MRRTVSPIEFELTSISVTPPVIREYKHTFPMDWRERSFTAAEWEKILKLFYQSSVSIQSIKVDYLRKRRRPIKSVKDFNDIPSVFLPFQKDKHLFFLVKACVNALNKAGRAYLYNQEFESHEVKYIIQEAARKEDFRTDAHHSFFAKHRALFAVQ